MQYSTEQLIKEVENSVAEFKQYNQDYDEDNIKQQVFNSMIWAFLVASLNRNFYSLVIIFSVFSSPDASYQ